MALVELTQALSDTLAIRGAYCDTGNVDFPLTVGDPSPVMPETLYRLVLVTVWSGVRTGAALASFNCIFSAGSD
jgi:hypothetical protein